MKRQRMRRRLVVASAILLPITLNYFSPYLMTTGAAIGIITGSFILWLVWSVAALFAGRAACGASAAWALCATFFGRPGWAP